MDYTSFKKLSSELRINDRKFIDGQDDVFYFYTNNINIQF